MARVQRLKPERIAYVVNWAGELVSGRVTVRGKLAHVVDGGRYGSTSWRLKSEWGKASRPVEHVSWTPMAALQRALADRERKVQQAEAWLEREREDLRKLQELAPMILAG